MHLAQLARRLRKEAPDFIKDLIAWGAGPRACQNLVLAGKVRAVLKGRFHVTIDDVEAVALPIMRHRIVPTFNAVVRGFVNNIVIEPVSASLHEQALAQAYTVIAENHHFDPKDKDRWTLQSLDVGPAYAAAIVIEGNDPLLVSLSP